MNNHEFQLDNVTLNLLRSINQARDEQSERNKIKTRIISTKGIKQEVTKNEDNKKLSYREVK